MVNFHGQIRKSEDLLRRTEPPELQEPPSAHARRCVTTSRDTSLPHPAVFTQTCGASWIAPRMQVIPPPVKNRGPAGTGLPFPRSWGCSHLRLLHFKTCGV